MATKNVILTDKNGEQIAPATVSDIVTYDDNASVKDKIDELNERIDELVTGNVIPLEITANGTYNAPEGVDGFNPVTTNVLPSKVLISEFDFTDTSTGDLWKQDTVKNVNLPVSSYTNITHTDNVGIIISGTGGTFDTQNRLNRYGVYEIDIEFGSNETSTFNSYNTILNFLRSGAHFALRWNNSQNKWQVSDATGATKWVESNNPHYFDGKKIKVTYGCRYIDGELVVVGYRNTMSIYLINNDDSLTELCYSNENYDEVYIKLGGGNSYLGFVYKNIKIYQHFDKYETPATLLNVNPTEEITEPIEDENR